MTATPLDPVIDPDHPSTMPDVPSPGPEPDPEPQPAER